MSSHGKRPDENPHQTSHRRQKKVDTTAPTDIYESGNRARSEDPIKKDDDSDHQGKKKTGQGTKIKRCQKTKTLGPNTPEIVVTTLRDAWKGDAQKEAEERGAKENKEAQKNARNISPTEPTSRK